MGPISQADKKLPRAVDFNKKALIKERKAGTKRGMNRRPLRPTHLAGTGCSHTGRPCASYVSVPCYKDSYFYVYDMAFSSYGCSHDEYRSVYSLFLAI